MNLSEMNESAPHFTNFLNINMRALY